MHMRTTLTIDDDVLSAAREMAEIENKSVGEVISTLARSSLSPEGSKLKTRNGVPLLKVPMTERSPMYLNYGPGALLENETRLYDLAEDPGQERPLHDPEEEARLVALMRALMQANDAPPEAFALIGL